jgi:cytochrome c-type biogenesis protein
MDNINISALAALAAGFASFLSPCVLPLVPIYLAGLAGPEIFQAKADRRGAHIFLHSLAFVAGFTVVFVLIGAGAGLAGFAIGAHLATIRFVANILLIVFGAILLLSLKFPRLNFIKHMGPSKSRATGYVRSFITGAIFTMVLTPCVGPILAGILTLAAVSQTAGRGAALLGIYSLGLGIPFLIIGAAFDAAMPVLRRIQKYSWIIYIVSGAVLIAWGILGLSGRLFWF